MLQQVRSALSAINEKCNQYKREETKAEGDAGCALIKSNNFALKDPTCSPSYDRKTKLLTRWKGKQLYPNF